VIYKKDVLADLRAGRIVSPKLVRKQLIATAKAQMDTFLGIANGAGYSEEIRRDARRTAERCAVELAEYKVLLANAEEVVARLDAEIARLGGWKGAGGAIARLRDLRREWEAEAAGLPHYARGIFVPSADVGDEEERI
jgi:hypothetical protein